MSRSVDLFVDSDLPIAEVADQLRRLAGVALTPSPDAATYVLRDGPVAVELGEHAYGDDGDLRLSRYRYALSARTPNDAQPEDTAEATLLRHIAHAARQRDAFPVLFVMDLQYREAVDPSERDDRHGDSVVS